MVTSLLVEYRAYDFADRWEEFVQGVLGELLAMPRFASEELELRLRRATLELLSQQLRANSSWNQDGELPWCESSRMEDHCAAAETAVVARFALEIGRLPEQRSQVVADVFGEGCSFDQVAAKRKLPLRMVKRFLRESIWDLRECGAQEQTRGRAGDDERVKSCLKSLELDLPAFLLEPQLEQWREFRMHYPVCLDCSLVVANWSRVEAMVREACGSARRHPSADDLVALHRDGEGLEYARYVATMRHLDGCPLCGEAMTLLARFDRRPIAELLIRQAGRRGSGLRRSRARAWLAQALSRIRARLG